MNKKITLILALLLISVGSLFGQSDFRNGFILTNNQDTIQGLVEYRSNSKNYESCKFSKDGIVTEYKPQEIVGFGYFDDKFFSSQIIQDAFVEVLVQGDMSLYKFKDKFLLEKDTATFELKSVIEQIEANGKIGYKEKSGWRGVLTYLISDCLANSNRLTAGITLDEKPLTKLIVKYNKCTEANFTVFKASKPWTKVDLGASVGIVRSEIRTIKNPGSFPYLDESYTSLDPTIGLLLSISSPRLTEKLAFQSELHFAQSSYASLVKVDEAPVEYHDSNINLTTFSIPLSVKYTLSKGNYGYYFQAGINYDYHIKSSTKLLSEQVIGNVVNTFPERTAFDVSKTQLGYFAGIGILKSYTKFNASIAVRYFQMYALNTTDGFSSNLNRVSINLILFKK